MFSSEDIRKSYIKFFEDKGHKLFESSSLIPNDPSILFTIAGMVPFKSFFLGQRREPSSRIVSCQKCFRTNDIENVGITARHLTFFEMLGNFSFGDYFKENAIKFAWEFLSVNLGLPKDRLIISVFKDDNESYDIWNKIIGVPESRIVRLGEESNFWQSGITGPCGACSEIYYDMQRNDFNKNLDSDIDNPRFLEIWNLVFMEYNRLENGELEPLSRKNVDTGMGLERIASVMQTVNSNFEIDTIRPIIAKIESLSGLRYSSTFEAANLDYSFRLIADHIRAAVFLINDGVLPSNEGRGYVLRKLIRRAMKHLIKFNNSFKLVDLSDIVVGIMESRYPELKTNLKFIKEVIANEELKFTKVLEEGIGFVNTEIARLKAKNNNKLESAVSFKLYDTFGFPYELTEEICKEQGIEVIHEEFAKQLEKQRDLSRGSNELFKSMKMDQTLIERLATLPKTLFTGYEEVKGTAIVLDVNSVANEENVFEVIVDTTPFYAKSGGQVNDTGIMFNTLFEADVIDVNNLNEFIIHKIKIKSGILNKGDSVEMAVDVEKRLNIKRNHTATHLLHAALRRVLGAHIFQAGSYVADDRLRFDFGHFAALKQEEIDKVEEIVNSEILENIDVNTDIMEMDEARKLGAMALFEEKYSDQVRVVSIGGVSKELCGGTHAARTGDIGLFKIIFERGIASNTRRIEAITGKAFLSYVKFKDNIVNSFIDKLTVPEEELINKLDKNLAEEQKLKGEIKRLSIELQKYELDSLILEMQKIGNVDILIKEFEDKDPELLKLSIDMLKEKFKDAIILFILTNSKESTAAFLIGVSDNLVKTGISAGKLVKNIAESVGGNGGGKGDFAKGGTKDLGDLAKVKKFAKKLIKEVIS